MVVTPGVIDASRECLGDDRVPKRDHRGVVLDLGRDAALEPADHQSLGADGAGHQVAAERRRQLLVLGVGQAIAEREIFGDVDPDPLRVALAQQPRQAGILILAGVGIPAARVEIGVAVAIERQPLDTAIGAALEQQDRAAARGHRRLGQQRHNHWIFVVLARGDDPGVEAHARHQLGQQRVEPLAQPVVAQIGLRAQRQQLGALGGDEIGHGWFPFVQNSGLGVGIVYRNPYRRGRCPARSPYALDARFASGLGPRAPPYALHVRFASGLCPWYS